jgi:hypothetical protein
MIDVFVLDGSENFDVYNTLLRYFPPENITFETTTDRAMKGLERGRYDLIVLSKAEGKVGYLSLVEKLKYHKLHKRCVIALLYDGPSTLRRAQGIIKGLKVYGFDQGDLGGFDRFVKELNR